MSFLVGNDFIPHLPHLHIHHDGLPMLWQTYMQVLPTCDGKFSLHPLFPYILNLKIKKKIYKSDFEI